MARESAGRAADIQAILDLRDRNGGLWWAREDGNIHAPAGFSTLLVLNVLGQLGAAAVDNTRVADAVEFVFSYQNDDGSFRYGPRRSRLPCITGQALAGLCELGAGEDPRSGRAFEWLVSNTHAGGGWRCPTVKLGKSAETDAGNPGATLFILDAFRFRVDLIDENSVATEAVESLLGHWRTRTPLGPCGFGIGSRFMTVEYPFSRYNIFYFVYVLSHFPSARADARFREAFDQLTDHVDGAGRLVVGNPLRAWQRFDFAQEDDLATRRFDRIRQLVGV